MSLVSGALSLSRFEIHFEKRRSSFSWNQLNKLIDPWKAGPLTLERKIAPVMAGWVFPTGARAGELSEEDLPPDHPWDLEMSATNGVIVLRLRIEKRQVPNQLLQELYRNEIYHLTAKLGHPPKSAEKKQLKQDLQNQLAQRTLPQVSYVEGLWFVNEDTLWVATTGKRLRDTFIEHFTKTFLEPLKAVALDVSAPLVAFKSLNPEDKGESPVARDALKLLSSAVPLSLVPSVSA